MNFKYSFCEAEPFLCFLEENKQHIAGQKICNFYSGAGWGGLSESPLVIELEQFSIIIHYFFYSDIHIHVVDKETVQQDRSLNFLWRDIPESRNVTEWVRPIDCPYIGSVIVGIKVERFSTAFEINPSTGETRPDGGDYFSTITVLLDDGGAFYICAADAVCDGYVEVWD